MYIFFVPDSFFSDKISVRTEPLVYFILFEHEDITTLTELFVISSLITVISQLLMRINKHFYFLLVKVSL